MVEEHAAHEEVRRGLPRRTGREPMDEARALAELVFQMVFQGSQAAAPPRELAGYLCEQCLEAPARALVPAPWGGTMGVCQTCQETGGEG